MTPFARLVRQRPTPDGLWRYKRRLAHPLEIAFADTNLEPGEVSWHLGPLLARDGSVARYVATYHSIHEGTFAVILHVREGALAPGDKPEGSCELGAILSSYEWYEYGAGVLALRDHGVRLSWEAAQWVHEAARGELVDLHHHDGKAHGALAPGHVRFALFDTPYGSYSERYLDRHQDGDVPSPLRFLRSTNQPGTDAQRAAELATLAFAIAQLTRHPEPAIDVLLHDPSPDAADVLGDLVLERAQPIARLLADRARDTTLPIAALAGHADPAIDAELRALWHRVLELDPMIDTTAPGVFDVAGPDL